MYGSPYTPIAGGGVGVLASTGSGNVVLPLVIALVSVVIGGLLMLRTHLLKKKKQQPVTTR